jgi:hypothetical protein
MNWDAIGAIGEIVGAAAVVATLFYLARQINDASKQVKMASLAELNTLYNDRLVSLRTSPTA